MKVLIVRHAKAEEREDFAPSGKPDALRPLTDAGRKQARKAGRALKEILPRIDALATSPLARALDTARLMAKEYKRLEAIELPALAPGGSEKAVLAWLQQHPADATVALVGHEPDLSALVCWLLTGRNGEFIQFKKGGVCLLEFAGAPQVGNAVLEWLLTPGQLRSLGR